MSLFHIAAAKDDLGAKSCELHGDLFSNAGGWTANKNALIFHGIHILSAQAAVLGGDYRINQRRPPWRVLREGQRRDLLKNSFLRRLADLPNTSGGPQRPAQHINCFMSL